MNSKTFRMLALIFALASALAILTSCAAEMPTNEVSKLINELGRDQVIVSFPGLGIQPTVINRVAFSFPLGGGHITVYWSGLIVGLGIALCFAYAALRAKYTEKIKSNDLFDVAIFVIIAAVLGARLYYVLTSLGKYGDFWSVFNIWDGGMAIFGALIGGALAIFFFCRKKKIDPLKMLDLAAPAAMLAQIVGRWGDFINAGSYGYEIGKNDPFYFIRMGIYPHSEESISAQTARLSYVHPTFLYEVVWNLIGFVIINLVYRKKKFDGQIFYLYMAWYGLGRMFIELLRTDSLYIGTLRISALVGALCCVAGFGFLALGLDKAKKIKLARQKYEKVYTNFRTGNPLTGKYEQEEETEINAESEKKENEDN